MNYRSPNVPALPRLSSIRRANQIVPAHRLIIKRALRWVLRQNSLPLSLIDWNGAPLRALNQFAVQYPEAVKRALLAYVEQARREQETIDQSAYVYQGKRRAAARVLRIIRKALT